ncbi:FIST signal transduction protein [Piscinibacter sp.]|uniref:FIST signal transduction protein n=1 Tax=Piscinibacter sp. TaxID=1903157 RepID=UPI002C547E04|nr:FIST N-terminal domain-containing protein [Albitalea sp.]HUG24951.1 FIST N-terminal domain-containing protein [Albitalea sp.]
MKLFLHAHATHPDAQTALALAAAQIEAQRTSAETIDQPTLGWLYFTDAFAGQAQALLDDARRRWPDVAWVGAVGIGIAGNGIEYVGEPAVSLMLGDVPREHFRIFSGVRPLTVGDSGFDAATAQVHADPATADLGELIGELAGRTSTGYLFGGLASARGGETAPGLHLAEGVFDGGLSGVAFSADVSMVSRVTQGCQPVGPVRHVTACERNVVLTLDDEPALDCLLGDLELEADEPREVVSRLRHTLVGLSDSFDDVLARPGQFGTDTRVRHLIGIDPARRGIAIGDIAQLGTQLAFCRRHVEAARRDLVRICSEIREELEPETLPLETALALQGTAAEHTAHPARRIAGAVYVSCAGRGGAHFGAPSAELAIVRHALGDVPLVGFFASGEIARHHLYGYTGVLTVFTG